MPQMEPCQVCEPPEDGQPGPEGKPGPDGKDGEPGIDGDGGPRLEKRFTDKIVVKEVHRDPMDLLVHLENPERMVRHSE